jgi:hypothetical protein
MPVYNIHKALFSKRQSKCKGRKNKHCKTAKKSVFGHTEPSVHFVEKESQQGDVLKYLFIKIVSI